MKRIAMFAAVMLTVVRHAVATSIGVYFDPYAGGEIQTAQVQVGDPVQVYVFAILGGDAAAGGIIAAEFRVAGYGGPWTGVAEANSAANYLTGDPLAGGSQIAFPTCMGNVPVLLYTISSLATGPFPTRTLGVESHQAPGNPLFPCARVILCDEPVYTSLCVSTGTAQVGAQTTGVESRAWFLVKGLYR